MFKLMQWFLPSIYTSLLQPSVFGAVAASVAGPLISGLFGRKKSLKNKHHPFLWHDILKDIGETN